MKILAIQQFHDMSICLYDSDSNEFQYIKPERLFNKKHIGVGSMKFFQGEKLSEIGEIHEILKIKNFLEVDVLVTLEDLTPKDKRIIEFNKKIYRSFSNQNHNLFMECKKVGVTGWRHSWNKDYVAKGHGRQIIKEIGIKAKKHIVMCHHYAHILSSFPLLENKKYEYGVCIDGMAGPEGELKTISFIENPLDIKNVKIKNNLFHKDSSIGFAFSMMGFYMNFKGSSLDYAGKLMGAQCYGEVNWKHIEKIKINEICENFTRYTGESLIEFTGFNLGDIKNKNIKNNLNTNFENKKFLNFLATWHKVAELSVLELFRKNIKNKNSNIIYSGGVVQNTVINESLKKEYPNVVFVPHCYDGGLSLGMIEMACKLFNLESPNLNNFPYLQFDNIEQKPSIKTIKLAAKYLSKNMILGWHQGRGEIGPRALGNRSILMNPSIVNGKNILNYQVKHREHWRPYAASVLEESAHDWFDFEGDSPYMMRAIKTKDSKIGIIPAVVHKDNTCRIQTVSKDNNESFYELIKEFYKLTGIPMVLNTSLNDGGFPISGNPSISKKMLHKGLDLLFIGDKKYIKKNILI